MTIDIDDVESALGSQDISLRIALAEAEVEISLLKAELVRLHIRLEAAELRAPAQAPQSGMVLSRTRSTAPPSVGPQAKICQPLGASMFAELKKVPPRRKVL